MVFLLAAALLLLLASCDNKSLKDSWWWGGGGDATAELTANPSSGAAPLKVTLKYKGTNADLCTLDFGDGSTPLYDTHSDCSGEVEHTYKKAGEYTAKFTAKVYFGGDSAEKSVKITVKSDSDDGNKAPEASISAKPTKGKEPLKVTFTLKASDPDKDKITCSLDFGDGSDASSKCSGDVEHTYKKAGEYTAKFTVKDSHDAKTEKSVKITVESSNNPPEASISAKPTEGKAPLKVTFTLSASDKDKDKITCSLDFGDGSDASSKCSGDVEHTYKKAGKYTAKFTVKDSHDAKTEKSVTITAKGKVVHIYAAGDIAPDSKSNTNDDATAKLILDKTKDMKDDWYALALGDLAYKDGEYSEFMAYYDPSWGKFKKKTYPIPGNHEYQTTNAAGYFKYWEEVEKGRTNPYDGWYAVDLGNGWRLYALNNYTDLSKTSTKQYKWLAQDLKDHKPSCIIAMSHEPRYSPGPHGDHSSMDAVWDLLYDYGGDILLSGHDHLYARFKPIDKDGNTVKSGEGMVQFVVGTGGINLYESRGHDKAEIVDNSVFGILELELGTGQYSFWFHTTGGKELDKGENISCRSSSK